MTKQKLTIPQNFDIEEKVAEAQAYFKTGYNCCQSVIMAYSDIIGLDKDIAATISSGFGGGMGRLREVCGSVSGMFLIAGFISPATNPLNRDERTENYALIQNLASQFKEINGSIVCKELLGISKQESPVPSERNAEYYKKRPCAEYVGISARLIGQAIVKASEKPSVSE